MRVTLLDSLPHGVIAGTLVETLRDAGVLAARHRLREERFAPCRGCFECWLTHPGTCRATDAANQLMSDLIGSDVVIWATQVRHGCWDSIAKAALDRCIGLVSPFFKTVEGETHHRRRYRHYPRWGVLAVTSAQSGTGERRMFRQLVQRNVLNLQETAPWVGFVPRAATASVVRSTISEGVATLEQESTPTTPHLEPFAQRPDSVGVPAHAGRPRHALLWVGSAKPAGNSTSESLGSHLLEQLREAGWTTETLHIQRSVKLGRDSAPKLVEAFRRADLVIAAAPVYVDCLPALVLAGLEQISRARLGDEAPVLLPIVQCGFPEIEHTTLALEVFARAAHQAGLGWAGHLAAGGGGGIDGRPLAKLGDRVRSQITGLELAAMALDRGQAVPRAASEVFTRPAMPAALYRLAGNLGWIAHALKHHRLLKLWDRPFAERFADQPRPLVRTLER